MSNELTPAISAPIVSDIQAGDMLVENIGNEVRFWHAISVEGKIRVRLTARSWVFMRERVLQSVSGNTIVPAADLTVAKLYSKKDPQNGMTLLLKYFPETAVAHFCYSGCGPSGHRWGFGKGWRTLSSARVEVR